MGRKTKTILKSVGLVFATLVIATSLFLFDIVHGRSIPDARANTIRIACVGDSITYGNPFFASKRYPQQLENMLGDDYSVRNFGVSGHTLQSDGDAPFRNHRYFKLSTEFDPDIVLIMLGTNDSKPQNWKGVEPYQSDYELLIKHYQQLPSKPKIILMTPPSAFADDDGAVAFGINATVIAEMASSVKRIGAKHLLDVIDIHRVTSTHPEYFSFDGIHPDGDGNLLIAKSVFQYIKNRTQ